MQYVPGPHVSMLLELTQKLPAGHGPSNVDPAGQWDPRAQVSIEVVDVHTLPAGHMDWLLDPVGQ